MGLGPVTAKKILRYVSPMAQYFSMWKSMTKILHPLLPIYLFYRIAHQKKKKTPTKCPGLQKPEGFRCYLSMLSRQPPHHRSAKYSNFMGPHKLVMSIKDETGINKIFNLKCCRNCYAYEPECPFYDFHIFSSVVFIQIKIFHHFLLFDAKKSTI